MAINKHFDINALFERLAEKLNIVFDLVVEALNKTCLEITIEAKQLKTYTDRTNNLRSSIGYVVYNRGEKALEHFQKDGNGENGDGNSGIRKGRALAEQAAKEYPNDIVGVIVAGEDYALYVESKGYDVLTGPCSRLQELFLKNLRAVFDGAGIIE